jgi:hypothetical protein
VKRQAAAVKARAKHPSPRPPDLYHTSLVQVAQERRQWARFGAAARESPSDSVTVQVWGAEIDLRTKSSVFDGASRIFVTSSHPGP